MSFGWNIGYTTHRLKRMNQHYSTKMGNKFADSSTGAYHPHPVCGWWSVWREWSRVSQCSCPAHTACSTRPAKEPAIEDKEQSFNFIAVNAVQSSWFMKKNHDRINHSILFTSSWFQIFVRWITFILQNQRIDHLSDTVVGIQSFEMAPHLQRSRLQLRVQGRTQVPKEERKMTDQQNLHS